MLEMFAITIGTDEQALTIDKYLSNYSVNIIERYSSGSNFKAVSGKSMNKYLGDKRELSVNFEPMETSQLNALIGTIKTYQNEIPISYIDPQYGNITRKFSCNTLPTATYFVSDDKRKFWTIPTVVFSEKVDESDDTDEDG